MFYGVSDGAKNGLIKGQYVDVTGVNTWLANGNDAYFGLPGSVGIGTASPSASYKLDVLGSIRSSSGLTVTSGAVSLPTGSIDALAIADGSLLFADWNQNGCTPSQIPKWNGSAWACATDAGIGAESDPIWMAASGSYYTKTDLQNSGQSAVHWGNLTNVPLATVTHNGVVQLNDTVTSTATNQAATANVVKSVWDDLSAAINGKMSGSGSVGYVAKFTGTGIVNSKIYENNGFVGVGTTDPTDTLEVNGNIKLSGTTPSYRLTNVADPLANNDAANKVYVDSKVSAAGTEGTSPYLSDGSYYSEGGDPYFCRLNVLAGTTQRIVSVNQSKKCDSTNNLYCSAGSCSADASVLNSIKLTNQLISARENTSCSISDGKVYCWGYVGNGQKYLDYSLSSVGANTQEGHSCAVTGAGEVKCMGYGNYGQLGNGGASQSPTAVSVSGINNAVKVYTASSGYSTNYGHSCALLLDGSVKCWGYLQSYGQANTPVAITGLTSVIDFSMSKGNASDQDHWCAVLSNGSVKCAGYGAYGQLGNGSTSSVNWTTPVTVSGISNAVKIYSEGS
jgi:hypothetical protein